MQDSFAFENHAKHIARQESEDASSMSSQTDLKFWKKKKKNHLKV